MLVLIGVFVIGLFASGEPALAHGKHELATDAVVLTIEARHIADDHEGHCHGGAYCSGPALIFSSPSTPHIGCQSARLGFPEATNGSPLASSFDPPPPRFLI